MSEATALAAEEIALEIDDWQKESPDLRHQWAKKLEWYDSNDVVEWDEDTGEPLVKQIDLDAEPEKEFDYGEVLLNAQRKRINLKKKQVDAKIKKDNE